MERLARSLILDDERSEIIWREHVKKVPDGLWKKLEYHDRSSWRGLLRNDQVHYQLGTDSNLKEEKVLTTSTTSSALKGPSASTAQLVASIHPLADPAPFRRVPLAESKQNGHGQGVAQADADGSGRARG
jgi:hypothetical protein